MDDRSLNNLYDNYNFSDNGDLSIFQKSSIKYIIKIINFI